MTHARTMVLALTAALCVGCSAGTTASPASSPTNAPGRSVAVPLADVADLGNRVSVSSAAAMQAYQEVWAGTPHSAYGGVVLAGGGGITISTVPGRSSSALDALIARARADGVIVQLRTGRLTLADLEDLGERRVFAQLPEPLRAHLVATQVDVPDNRVIAGFDIPVDDTVRATVARVFGKAVAVAHVDGPNRLAGGVAHPAG